MNEKMRVEINDTISKAISENHTRQHKIENAKARENHIQKSNIERYNNITCFILGIMVAVMIMAAIYTTL